MDAHDIENVIEEELEKMSVNFSDVGSDSDTDIEDDFTASNEMVCLCVFTWSVMCNLIRLKS